MKRFTVTIVLAAISCLFCPENAFTMEYVVVNGEVEDAIDCTEAGWHIVRCRQTGSTSAQGDEVVNPYDNKYGWVLTVAEVGDEVVCKIIDNGDGYTAGPVSMLLIAGQNVLPIMHLTKEGITQCQEYPSCPDVDVDYVNDRSDNCVFTFNFWQEDTDNDGIGDDCDKCNGPCPCTAANLDGLYPIDFSDLSLIADSWAVEGAGLLPDIDGNERVDLIDFAVLANYWLADCNT